MYYNKITQRLSTELPSQITTEYGVTNNPDESQLVGAGWVLTPVIEPETPEGMFIVPNSQAVSYDADTNIASFTYMYEDQAAKDARLLGEREAAELYDEQLESDYQATKSQDLKDVENQFYELCKLIFGNYEKRGFAEIKDALEAMLATDTNTSVVLSLKLLGINAEGVKEGGNDWWDDAVMHA